MITDKFDEVFRVLNGFLTDESKYSPLVTKQSPLRPTTFPVVEVKSQEIERETTTRDEEIFNTLDVTINIYSIEKTIDRKKVSSLQISNELIKLIDMAMKEMKFTMETNEEIENVDKNVYRRLLRYTAGIDVRTGKLVRRK